MEGMTAPIGWGEIALRLAVTVGVGIVIGYNRSEHGKAAGMRTTLIVCLAASVSMIQVNLLLPTAGRPEGSFVMNDLMRLPLGILTGVGFIGGGAILRRETLVIGVTTAATLWLVTVIGLCIGGGQIGLGLAATAIGFAALWLLRAAEARFRHESRARIEIDVDGEGPDDAAIRYELEEAGLGIVGSRLSIRSAEATRRITFEVRYLRHERETAMPEAVKRLAARPHVTRLVWNALG
jgi:putative Mg2+ transporter-C (MgtC) family protein